MNRQRPKGGGPCGVVLRGTQPTSFASTMPKIRSCNDIDFAKKDQYIVPPTRKAKQPPPEPWELPNFEPLEIEDWNYSGEPNLPPSVDLSSPFDMWSLFFSDELMDKIAKWTNTFAMQRVFQRNYDASNISARRCHRVIRLAAQLIDYVGRSLAVRDIIT